MVRVIEFSDVLEAVRKLAREAPEPHGLRERVEASGLLVRLGNRGGFEGRVVAVDSAFPKSPVYLLGYALSLVAVAIVSAGEGGFSKGVKSWLLAERLGELDQDYVAGFARLKERLEAVASARGARAVLLDGELVPRPGRSPVWREVEGASRRLLDLVDAGVCVAGVLKRSYSASLASRLGFEFSDRVLASLTLQRGEAIVAEHSSRLLHARGCFEALYKPPRGLPAAVRVELCCPGGREEALGFLSWLAGETGASGLPWMIDLVDSLAKREASKASAVEALLLSSLARRGLQHLGYSANPQESMRRGRGSRQ